MKRLILGLLCTVSICAEVTRNNNPWILNPVQDDKVQTNLQAQKPATSPALPPTPSMSNLSGMSQESAGVKRKLPVSALTTAPQAQQNSGPAQTVTPVTPLDYAVPTPIISGKYEVDICSSLPQTGEVAIVGEEVAAGMQAFALKIKTAPEFNFYVKIDARDDGGDISKTRKNIEKLNLKTPLFISLFGSNTMKGLVPYLKQNKLVSIFPIEGLEKWRKAANKNTIFFRASDGDQMAALIDYSINSLHKKRFAVFFEASEWGDGIHQQIKNILKERNVELLESGSYPQKTVSVSRAVKKISDKDPDAILCISQSRPAYYFIQQMIDNGFTKASFLCVDRLISIQETLKKSRGVTITTASVVPDPAKSKFQIVNEYRNDMKKYYPNKKLSPFSLEGYINMAIACECIKAAQFPLSANKLLNTIVNVRKFIIPRLNDLNLNFDSQTRSLSRRIWINDGGEDEWQEWHFKTERA